MAYRREGKNIISGQGRGKCGLLRIDIYVYIPPANLPLHSQYQNKPFPPPHLIIYSPALSIFRRFAYICSLHSIFLFPPHSIFISHLPFIFLPFHIFLLASGVDPELFFQKYGYKFSGRGFPIWPCLSESAYETEKKNCGKYQFSVTNSP